MADRTDEDFVRLAEGAYQELVLANEADSEACPRCKGRGWTWTFNGGYADCTMAEHEGPLP